MEKRRKTVCPAVSLRFYFGSKVPVGGPLRRRHGAGGNRGAFRCGFQLCGKVTALLLRGDIALRQELVIGIHDRTHTDLVVCSQLSFGWQLSIYRQVFEIGAKSRKQ